MTPEPSWRIRAHVLGLSLCDSNRITWTRGAPRPLHRQQHPLASYNDRRCDSLSLRGPPIPVTFTNGASTTDSPARPVRGQQCARGGERQGRGWRGRASIFHLRCVLVPAGPGWQGAERMVLRSADRNDQTWEGLDGDGDSWIWVRATCWTAEVPTELENEGWPLGWPRLSEAGDTG